MATTAGNTSLPKAGKLAPIAIGFAGAAASGGAPVFTGGETYTQREVQSTFHVVSDAIYTSSIGSETATCTWQSTFVKAFAIIAVLNAVAAAAASLPPRRSSMLRSPHLRM